MPSRPCPTLLGSLGSMGNLDLGLLRILAMTKTMFWPCLRRKTTASWVERSVRDPILHDAFLVRIAIILEIQSEVSGSEFHFKSVCSKIGSLLSYAIS